MDPRAGLPRPCFILQYRPFIYCTSLPLSRRPGLRLASPYTTVVPRRAGNAFSRHSPPELPHFFSICRDGMIPSVRATGLCPSSTSGQSHESCIDTCPPAVPPRRRPAFLLQVLDLFVILYYYICQVWTNRIEPPPLVLLRERVEIWQHGG